MSKLVAAAIKFYPKDSEYPQIVCGKRHCNCFEWMFNHRVEYDKKTHIQGFLTDENQFVDRYDAFIIAVNADQLLPQAKEEYEGKKVVQLFSEDVW
jgi:hypothetical protein